MCLCAIKLLHLNEWKVNISYCLEWYCGYMAKNKAMRGVFPKSYVCIKEAIIDRSGLESFSQFCIDLWNIYLLYNIFD